MSSRTVAELEKISLVGQPTAYFITWSCRGAWLHGDARGSVDRAHNRFGTPRLGEDCRRKRDAERAIGASAIRLGLRERAVVLLAIGGVCRRRGWDVLAVNVRATHVHCVVSAPGTRPEAVMQLLKSWATRRLREVGFSPDYSPWTRHGSTHYLWNRTDVNSAVRYVFEMQDEMPRP